MVLADLGAKLSSALSSLASSNEVDDATINKLTSSVCMALLQSDVDVKLIKKMQTSIKDEWSKVIQNTKEKEKQLGTQSTIQNQHQLAHRKKMIQQVSNSILSIYLYSSVSLFISPSLSFCLSAFLSCIYISFYLSKQYDVQPIYISLSY
jgi:hypothetical protein